MRVYLCIAVALLWSGCKEEPAKPAATPQPPAPSIEPKRLDKPLVWRVKGTDGPSYLLGSNHFIPGELLPEWVFDKVAEADTFYSEDSTEDSDDEAPSATYLPDGQSLSERLGPELWKVLTDNIEVIPDDALDRLQPWMASFLLEAEVTGASLTVVGIDDALERRARKAGKPMINLDKNTDEIMANVSSKFTVDMLKHQLEHFDAYRANASDQAYLRGDFERLSAEFHYADEGEKFPEFFDFILYDRNIAWANELEVPLRRGKVFVVAGVGHFSGDRGLLELLRKQGLTVERYAP